MPLPHRAPLIARHIEGWFFVNQRDLPWRRTYDPYQVWVSEVMLQQTRMEVVLPYFERFIERFPTVHALAAATESEVVAQWSGLGYYRRARMLRAGAADVVARHGGLLPRGVRELQAIEGIGRYTAGAIASIAFDERAPIVDGNVARIIARLSTIETPLGSAAFLREAWTQAEALVAASSSPRLFNQGLMELGALVCTPREPECGVCPLAGECEALAADRVDELPRPKQPGATRELHIPLYLITDGAGQILLRRENGELMKSLFHLPHGNRALFAARPLSVQSEQSVGVFRHTVTNRRITFEVIRAELAREIRDAGDYAWIELSSLPSLPHPSYVRKALEMAGV